MIGASASSVPLIVPALHDLQAEIHVMPDLLRQDVGSLVGRAVVFDQRLANFLRAGADQLDLALQQKAQAIDRIDIERVAHGDDQSGLAEADRDNLEPSRILRANLVITSGGMILAERSIQSMSAWAARLRDTSASETTPSLTRDRLSVSPFHLDWALRSESGHEPASWRTLRM